MTTPINARFARVGDIVQSRDNPDVTEVVKKVEIVLTLGNGAQEIYQTTDNVEYVEQEALPEEPPDLPQRDTPPPYIEVEPEEDFEVIAERHRSTLPPVEPLKKEKKK